MKPPPKATAAATLIVLLAWALAPVAQAQASSDSVAADTISSVPEQDRKVFLIAEKKALAIPESIGRVDFGYSSPGGGAAQPGANAKPHVEAVRFFAEERQLGTTIKGRRVGRDAMTAEQQETFFQLRSRGLQSLWARYRPEFIRRIFRPPFDTVAVNKRTGELVKTHDHTLHYVVILQDSSQREGFVEAARKLPGVINAHLPPEIKSLDSSSSSGAASREALRRFFRAPSGRAGAGGGNALRRAGRRSAEETRRAPPANEQSSQPVRHFAVREQRVASFLHCVVCTA